ncbi:MAG: signal peptidase II [Acidimicrobiales bacterium]
MADPATDPAADELSTEGTTEPEAPAVEPPRRLGIVAVVALAVIALDQLTKRWAVSSLSDGHSIHVVGSLHLDLYFNTGVAFSMGSGNRLGPLITLLAIGVVIGVAFGSTSRYPLGAVAAGLIAGGALGNLIDRAFRGDEGFLHGAVVDFIDPRFWPVFNVADACGVVGAFLLVIASLRRPAA